jgi:hypothetical protein
MARASGERPDLRIVAALAHSEFEAWFLAAIESLRGCRGVRIDAQPPEAPEAIRGAKERLQSLMSFGRHYSETVDQAALAATMDLDLAARRSPSFERFRRRVAALLEQLTRDR